MAQVSTKPHVALLASPGIGHLIPNLELGDRLISRYGFDVTIFVVVTDPLTAESQLKQQPSYKKPLNAILLPPVDMSRIPDIPPAILSQLVLLVRLSLPDLRSSIASMKNPPTALIVDIFGMEAFPIADEFNMLKYVFFTSNAWFLALTLFNPYISKEREDDHVLRRMPLDIPGCESILYEDTLDVYINHEDKVLHDDFVAIGLQMAKSDGILVNTCEALEMSTLHALRDPKDLARYFQVNIYPIGPLVRGVQAIRSPGLKDEVLQWLDQQPNESVLYVSFGSGGTLCANQLNELAWGLEKSHSRFIWVVRPPIEDSACGAYFQEAKRSDGTPKYLPDGFVTRTKEIGVVVPMWASQKEILAHRSVGGFLTHCGWNSTLESIINGVPLIAWPLYAEQTMNATLVTDQLGIAARSTERMPNGVLGRDEIEKMVRTVMNKEDGKGKTIRAQSQDLKSGTMLAVAEGGSSYTALSKMARECEIGLVGLKQMARGA